MQKLYATRWLFSQYQTINQISWNPSGVNHKLWDYLVIEYKLIMLGKNWGGGRNERPFFWVKPIAVKRLIYCQIKPSSSILNFAYSNLSKHICHTSTKLCCYMNMMKLSILSYELIHKNWQSSRWIIKYWIIWFCKKICGVFIFLGLDINTYWAMKW